ncbi:MAG: beta-lactamase family protein [Acidobacteria bacterium]|nr:beta-lactamase family protein [Acidobacteriota bacterium]
MRTSLPVRALAVSALAIVLVARPGSAQGPGLVYSLFDRYVDSLRQQTGIPGLSAVIMKDGQVAWEGGFGHQDLERNVLAGPDTPYPVGSLTQTITMVLLGTCVDRGELSVDDPMGQWVTDFVQPRASVRQVLAHASDGNGSARFQYDPVRFSALTAVAQGCDPQPLRTKIADLVLDRLAMTTSVPGMDLADPSNPARSLFSDAQTQRYDSVLSRLAVPYRVDRSLRSSRADYLPRGINAAEGLVSSARDLATFVNALETATILDADTVATAWTPANFGNGPLPTGLGWFVQPYQSDRLIWHFSQTEGYSGLILKMPARGLTLVMLANSDGLSSGAGLDQGDVTTSPFVKIFLRLFA